jgi:hypothetical protein
MPVRIWIRLAEIALTLLLAAAVIFAWREARSDRAQQQARDSQLNDTLAGIAAEKKSATTPDQLLAGITRELGMPAPLTLASNREGNSGANDVARVFRPASAANPKGNSPPSDPSSAPKPVPGQNTASPPNPNAQSQLPNAPAAQIPAADLKPLYDYILDCKACQAKLAASQADLTDEKAKTAAMTQARDVALKAAKGGSAFQRTVRALKWFALGAAGAIAAKTAR